MSQEGTSCKKCIHYTDSLGDNGFCKFYRHNITVPDKICSMYQTNSTAAGDDPPAEVDLGLLESFKKDGKNFWLIPGIIGCLLLFLISVVFLSPFELSIVNYSGIPAPTKIAVTAVMSLAVIGFFLLLLYLTLKFRPVRIAVSLITVVVIIFTLFNYSALWYSVNSYVTEFCEIILNM